LTKKLKLHLLEQKGKLFYSLAADFTAKADEATAPEAEEKAGDRCLDD